MGPRVILHGRGKTFGAAVAPIGSLVFPTVYVKVQVRSGSGVARTTVPHRQRRHGLVIGLCPLCMFEITGQFNSVAASISLAPTVINISIL